MPCSDEEQYLAFTGLGHTGQPLRMLTARVQFSVNSERTAESVVGPLQARLGCNERRACSVVYRTCDGNGFVVADDACSLVPRQDQTLYEKYQALLRCTVVDVTRMINSNCFSTSVVRMIAARTTRFINLSWLTHTRSPRTVLWWRYPLLSSRPGATGVCTVHCGIRA